MRLFGRQAFTLVELLITVAIIGVLATIGVPTYRKMIQKAKQTEAKTNLAALYKMEAAFYAETNTYGTNLTSVGFTPETAEGTLISGASINNYPGLMYTTGFTQNGGACAPITPFFYPD